ncbi:NAD(P)H-hydrate dehydratase, partial [Candidatus Woesebacteria bacterium]|nr:NAD(P)H-hydrate dehydratase [Candidatus Woesebacteria bacterium]
MTQSTIDSYLKQLKLPEDFSHKGQNGKVLVIGGSELFHAASRWSLDMVSKLVDMVFYTSVPSNNELIKEAKGEFWSGIVIERSQLEDYLQEAEVVVIGPGMERSGDTRIPNNHEEHLIIPTETEWNQNTARITNYLLAKYPDKRWVVDAGALQMVDPILLGKTTIITPHHGELERLEGIINTARKLDDEAFIGLPAEKRPLDWLLSRGVTVLLKGHTDYVYAGETVIEVTGGSPGMTKGGTGDVLAGLVGGLYCRQDAVTAAVIASYVNKRAGEELATTVGPFFNASDLLTK